MKRYLSLFLLLIAGSALGVGTSATLNWTLPTSYIDGTTLPASDIASTTIEWFRPGSSTAAGSVTVATPAVTTVVSGLVCGNFNFVARVTTTGGLSSDNTNPASYSTGVACVPNPPSGLTVN